MLQIRPVSDLRNNFGEISKIVHEEQKPIFLTKNGYGDMVVLSFEQYENMLLEARIAEKLRKAEIQAVTTAERYDWDVLAEETRGRLENLQD